MNMDNIKLYGKNKNELKTITPAVRACNEDIGMEFGREKCTMLIMTIGKWHMKEGMELSNQEKIKTLGEKEKYKCLGTLEGDIIKHVEMTEKI